MSVISRVSVVSSTLWHTECGANIAGRSRCIRTNKVLTQYRRWHARLQRSSTAAGGEMVARFQPAATPNLESTDVTSTQCEAQGTHGSGSASAPASQQLLGYQPELASPAKTYLKMVATGAGQADKPAWQTFYMAVMAGVYVSMGGLLLLSVGGASVALGQTHPGLQKLLLGAVGLQSGLMFVIICGAELFTSNTAYMTTAFWEGEASGRQLLRNWFFSYTGNLVGCLAMVAAVQAAGILHGNAAAAMHIAAYKTSHTFTESFVRGVLANWLVCIAAWCAAAASSLPGKLLGLYVPILTFVAIGLEHSVANMFLIPMGIVAGAPVTWAAFLTGNLLPVTLGNIVGGSICMATSYSLIFGRLNPSNKSGSMYPAPAW